MTIDQENTNPVFATTRLVDGVVLTLESLHDFATCVNENDRKPAMGVEHDVSLPPLGQIISCRIAPTEDGFHAAIGDYDLFPDPKEITLPTGEILYQQQSGKHRFPFVSAQFDRPTTFCVAIDATGLGGHQQADAFFGELKAETGVDFETQTPMRRSLIPDPIVIFTASAAISGGLWLGKQIGEAAGDVLKSESKAFFQVLVSAVKTMAKNAIPQHRPVTYVMQIHGEPNLEFVACSRDAPTVIAAMANLDIPALRPQIDRLNQHLDPEFIQFVLADNGEWQFNFVLTKTGKVIGEKRAFDRRAKRLKEFDKHASRK
jgi:hypothetical protein